MFLIELQVLCLVKNTHMDAGLEDAGGMLQRGYEFRSQPAGTRERKQGRMACALARLDSVQPPCFLLEVTTGHQLVFSAPPNVEQQWVFSSPSGKDKGLGVFFFFQSSFCPNCEEHPLDFVESLNYRVL